MTNALNVPLFISVHDPFMGLVGEQLDGIRFQLLHRTALALLTAERFAANHAAATRKDTYLYVSWITGSTK
jgi:uncharacterized protein DUF6946